MQHEFRCGYLIGGSWRTMNERTNMTHPHALPALVGATYIGTYLLLRRYLMTVGFVSVFKTPWVRVAMQGRPCHPKEGHPPQPTHPMPCHNHAKCLWDWQSLGGESLGGHNGVHIVAADTQCTTPNRWIMAITSWSWTSKPTKKFIQFHDSWKRK